MRRLVVASAIVFAATVARADEARDALADFVKCADITDSAKRLECFDAATARGKATLAQPAPPVQTAQPPKEKTWLEWFGFSKPSPPTTTPEEFGKPKPAPVPEPGELTQISDTVLEFAKTARGKAIFILQNGQVWRQLDADSSEILAPPPGKPMKVTIELGFLSSYNLTIEGRNGLIKVTRLK